jgi:adenylate cyclase
VREENDFFGQTVQLAARICDKANANETFITPSVHDLCQSHAFAFTEAGSYALKGIDEPVTAYAVGWHPATTSPGQADS